MGAADEYTVRAGGIATFPVLANDAIPKVIRSTSRRPERTSPTPGATGVCSSPDGELRYEAPERPATPSS